MCPQRLAPKTRDLIRRAALLRNAVIGLTLLSTTLVAWTAAQQQPASAPATPAARPDVPALLADLGAEEYEKREAATRALLALGAPALADLRAHLESTQDVEVRYRLRYILENLTPPAAAVMVVHQLPGIDLAPGDLVTHVGPHRVRSVRELLARQALGTGGSVLRAIGPAGPRETAIPAGVELAPILLDYAAPRGEAIVAAVRLYAAGYAEQAYTRLDRLDQVAPESELSRALLARIAFAAGDGTRAFELLRIQRDIVRPASERPIWSAPSQLDLAGPGKAPYHLEWRLYTEGGPELYSSGDDPDLRVQRVLIPAGRLVDAFQRSADFWWSDYREALGDEMTSRRTIAGNQLAIMSLMLSRLGLRSECCRLIEPRSEILRRSVRGRRKWVRVETDAWLPFIAGETRAAVDGFYEDALDVLQQPPRPEEGSAVIRNPFVAARIAFFLYQPPVDPRAADALQVVNHAQHPALPEYLTWMLDATEDRNVDAIREHLQRALPNLRDAQVAGYALAVALLEHVQARPDPEIIATARQRVLDALDAPARAVQLATLDALRRLAAGKTLEARELIASLPNRNELATLRSTIEFLAAPPPGVGAHDSLRNPIAAVPIGAGGTNWLVLTRDRRLIHFDADAGRIAALPAPEPGWFPAPGQWPWISRDPESGRVWAYGRRRVIEMTPDTPNPLRLNLPAQAIPDFDRLLASHFATLADAIAASPVPGGENGEFLRAEVKAGAVWLPDPDLPEIAMIRAMSEDDRVVHVALRGGPHVLLDASTGRAWTSLWIQRQLSLDAAPVIFAQAQWRTADDIAPVLHLFTDHGLIRFDLATEMLKRMPLPGETPFPPLIPESTPYTRRDPAYVHFARLPQDGGRVYRLTLSSGEIEPLDIVNEALPDSYYQLRTRAMLRDELDRHLASRGVGSLNALIDDAVQRVQLWNEAGKENR